MPDDNYAVIDRSSITRAAGGLRTLCRECQHLRSDVLLLFSSGHLSKEQQSTVFTALLKGYQVSAAADGGTSTNVSLSQIA